MQNFNWKIAFFIALAAQKSLIDNVGPKYKCDCHGDFKSVGKFSSETYVDRSTAEVVF